MSSLSSPLNLKGSIRTPGVGIDFLPIVDVLLVSLCFMLFGSQYIFAPGVSIDLPQVSYLESERTFAVLTLKQEDMLIYEGRIYTLNEFKRTLLAADADLSISGKVLLLKLNKDVSLQTFLKVCDITREAGFAKLQIASEHEVKQPSILSL